MSSLILAGIRNPGSVMRNPGSGSQTTQSVTKRKVASNHRRERTSERWQALGVGPQRKVRN